MAAFCKVAAPVKVTPYMHVLHVEVPQMIERYGSMTKWCCQSIERMHHWSQFMSMYASNRKAQSVCGTVLSKITLKGLASEASSSHRGAPRETKVGGNLGKHWANNAEAAKAGHKERMAVWEASGRTTFFPCTSTLLRSRARPRPRPWLRPRRPSARRPPPWPRPHVISAVP